MNIKFLFKFKYNIINNLPSFKTLRKNQTNHMKTIQGKTKFNILDFIDDEAEVSDTNTKNKNNVSKSSCNDDDEQKNEYDDDTETIDETQLSSKELNKNIKQNQAKFIQDALKEEEKEIQKLLHKKYTRKNQIQNQKQNSVKYDSLDDLKLSYISQNKRFNKDQVNEKETKTKKIKIGFKCNQKNNNNDELTPIKEGNTNSQRSNKISEEMEMLKYSYDKKQLRKIAEQPENLQQNMENRLKENEMILRNVIQLNLPKIEQKGGNNDKTNKSQNPKNKSSNTNKSNLNSFIPNNNKFLSNKGTTVSFIQAFKKTAPQTNIKSFG